MNKLVDNFRQLFDETLKSQNYISSQAEFVKKNVQFGMDCGSKIDVFKINTITSVRIVLAQYVVDKNLV